MEREGFKGYGSGDALAIMANASNAEPQYSGFLGFEGDLRTKRQSTSSKMDDDIFYNPTSDEEWDDYIAQRVAEGFDIFGALAGFPGAVGALVGETVSTFKAALAEDKLETFVKAVPSGVEGLLRGTTDLGGFLMEIAGGSGGMLFNVLTDDTEKAYHQLPDFLKDASRQWFKTSRSIQQRRARQYMGEATFLPPHLINSKLSEGLSIFLDATVPLTLGTSAIAKGGAKALIGATKPVSKNLAKFAINSGQGADALFQSATFLPRLAAEKLAQGVDTAAKTVQGAREIVSDLNPKRMSGEPFVELPAFGQNIGLDWIKRNTNKAGDIAADAKDLRDYIKKATDTPYPASALDRIARDPSVPVGARDIANVLNSFNSKHPYISFAARRVGDAAQGAAIGGVMGLLTFDEDIAANAMAGGALFGPLGKLAGSAVFSREYQKKAIDNFLQDHREKLSPDESATFEKFVGGDREKEKFVASLSYLIKNGHFKNEEGPIDIRYLSQEQIDSYSKISGDEVLPHVRGIHRISGGRPEIIINVDQANIGTFAEEVGHAFAGMPQIRDEFAPVIELLFGKRVVTDTVLKDGSKKVEFDFDGNGIFSTKALDDYFKKYRDSARPELRAILDERLNTDARKRRYAADEILASSMANTFKRYDPFDVIKKKSIGNFFNKAASSYQKPSFSLNPKSVLGGLVDMLLFRRNSLGLLAAHNVGLAMGFIKKGDPIKQVDTRIDSSFLDIIQARKQVMNKPEVKASDTEGLGLKVSDLRKPENAALFDFLKDTLPVKYDKDGKPTKRLLSEDESKTRDRKFVRNVTEQLKGMVNTDFIPGQKPFQRSNPDNPKSKVYNGDFLGENFVNFLLSLPFDLFSPIARKNTVYINEILKKRSKNAGTGIIEGTYTKLYMKKGDDSARTSVRQILPYGWLLDGNGLKIVGLDVNDIITRIESYEGAVKGARKEIWDIWRQESKANDKHARDLFLQDLWVYISGISKGIPGKRLVGEVKRDALSRFMGFKKKNFELVNPNQFAEIIESTRLVNSFLVNRLQNIRHLPGDQMMTEFGYYNMMGNLSVIPEK